MNSLHCAGNDAHYTLRVLLALLKKRHGGPFGQLMGVVERPVPAPRCWEVLYDGVHWEDHMGSDGRAMFDL